MKIKQTQVCKCMSLFLVDLNVYTHKKNASNCKNLTTQLDTFNFQMNIFKLFFKSNEMIGEIAHYFEKY